MKTKNTNEDSWPTHTIQARLFKALVTAEDETPDYSFPSKAFGAAEDEASSLIFMAHGFGFNRTAMYKMAALAAEQIPGARIECPDAPEQLGSLLLRTIIKLTPAFSKAAEGKLQSLQWFAKAKTTAAVHGLAKEAADAFNAHIDKRRDALGLQDKDIALAGFSQGGMMSLYTAWRRENPIGCVISHSMSISKDDIQADGGFVKSKQPTLFMYGGKDEFFAPAFLEASAETAKKNASDFETVIVDGLSHRMSSESRQIVVDHLKAHL